MNDTKRSIRLLILAAACCFALVLIPVSSYAVAQLGGVAHGVQHGVQKGAEGVQKGVEGTYNKGKEAITGEDQDQNQQQATPSDENRMKTQPGTESEQNEQTKSQTSETGQKQMPRTAGELPLLVMTGLLSLAGARATRRMK
jgi:hypothetical protein